jgi:hypothetical protein
MGWINGANLRRVRPELLAQLGATEALQRADALLADRGPSRAAKALRVSNRGAWFDEAKRLEQARCAEGRYAISRHQTWACSGDRHRKASNGLSSLQDVFSS